MARAPKFPSKLNHNYKLAIIQPLRKPCSKYESPPKMIRKQARERRDYLYRRALTLRDAELASKRAALKASLASGKPLDPSVANDDNLKKGMEAVCLRHVRKGG
jgi:hypothetical protein